MLEAFRALSRSLEDPPGYPLVLQHFGPGRICYVQRP